MADSMARLMKSNGLIDVFVFHCAADGSRVWCKYQLRHYHLPAIAADGHRYSGFESSFPRTRIAVTRASIHHMPEGGSASCAGHAWTAASPTPRP